MCISREKETYFEELMHEIMKTGKFRICRMGQQTGDSEKSKCCSLSPKAVRCRVLPHSQEASL
jgi:hypothetical protein